MNIVVTSPKDADLEHKLDDVRNSFWSLPRKPQHFKAGEIIWIVRDGRVVGGFYIRRITKFSKPLEYAEGHNPNRGWRFWFDSEVDEELAYYGVLSEDGTDFLIKCRGFQGFRYQLPCTKDDLISILKVEGLTEKEARSLIWNMSYRAYIYLNDIHLLAKV